MMKTKNVVFACLLLMLMSISPVSNEKKGAVIFKSPKSSVTATSLQQIVNQTVGQKPIQNAKNWLNCDDSEDFLCVEFETGGYAVFYKENMEMLEYSPNKRLPSLDDDIYYFGPNNTFTKTPNGFKNRRTNEKISVNKDVLTKKANSIRSFFSRRTKKKMEIDFDINSVATSGGASHPIDTDNPIHLDYGTRIPNHTYFDITPEHGWNSEGTCGAVAAEMLLTYHNYYSDRRIIPNNFLNGDSTANKEDNPSYCTDPVRMTHKTLGARGKAETDNNDSNNYFAKIVKKIPINAAYFTVTSGLKSLLKERKDTIGESFTYSVNDKYGGWFFGSLMVNTNEVRTEVDEGRPSIVLMQQNLGGTNHYVVAYGYEQYAYPGTSDTYNGFITNFGYGYDDTDIWVNSSWICAYITMEVNHEHNYSLDGQISGTLKTKYKCTTCGYRTDAVILDNTSSLMRCEEKFVNLPLNRDLYDRFSYPDNYLLRRDNYKYYYFKPTQSGNRLMQTFSNESTEISILDADKKTVLSSSSSGGFFRNAFLNFNFNSGKVYYIRANLFPLRGVGDIKLVITPTVPTYSNYNSILHISGENITQGITLSKQGVSVITFTPLTAGEYRFTTNGSLDNVIYFADPWSGTEKALFDDDTAGHMQATITKTGLDNSTRYFIIVSLYQLYSLGSNVSASLSVEKVS